MVSRARKALAKATVRNIRRRLRELKRLRMV
jgi:hypothetical protein